MRSSSRPSDLSSGPAVRLISDHHLFGLGDASGYLPWQVEGVSGERIPEMNGA